MGRVPSILRHMKLEPGGMVGLGMHAAPLGFTNMLLGLQTPPPATAAGGERDYGIRIVPLVDAPVSMQVDALASLSLSCACEMRV